MSTAKADADETATDLFDVLNTPMDYELNTRLEFDLCRYPPQDANGSRTMLPYITGEYVLAAGRFGDSWRLDVRFVPEGQDDDDWDRREPPFLSLLDQADGPDPLLLLRALLTGLHGADEAARGMAQVGLRVAMEGLPEPD